MLEPVTLEREKTLRLPKHEILLSFDNDSGAELFHDWWIWCGEEHFNQWCTEYQEGEEE